MNPLSAIRLPVSPDLMRAAAPALSPDVARPVIPQYELGKLAPTAPLAPSTEIAPSRGTFESTLGRMVAEVSGKQAAASDAVSGLLAGQGVPLHQAVIAMEEVRRQVIGYTVPTGYDGKGTSA